MNSHVIDAKHCAKCGSNLSSKGSSVVLPKFDKMTNLEVRICSNCAKKAKERKVKLDEHFFTKFASSMAKDCKELHEFIVKSPAMSIVPYPVSESYPESPFSKSFSEKECKDEIYASFFIHKQVASYHAKLKEKSTVFKAFNNRSDFCPICGKKLVVLSDGFHSKKIEYGCPDGHLVNFVLDLRESKPSPIPRQRRGMGYWDSFDRYEETAPTYETFEELLDRKIAFFADSLLIPGALRKACEAKLCADKAWQHPSEFPNFKAKNCKLEIVCCDGKLSAGAYRYSTDPTASKSYDELIQSTFGAVSDEIREKAASFVDGVFSLASVRAGKKKLEVEKLLETYNSYCKKHVCKVCKALQSKQVKAYGKWQEVKFCGNFEKCAFVSETHNIDDLKQSWSLISTEDHNARDWSDGTRSYYKRAAEHNECMFIDGKYCRDQLRIVLDPPCFMFNDTSSLVELEDNADASQCKSFYDKEPFVGLCTITKQKCLFAGKNACRCQIFEKKGK